MVRMRLERTEGLVFLLALVARAMAAFGMAVIPRDGIAYLTLAGNVTEGGPAEAFKSIQHPLYPLVGALLGGTEAALLTIGVIGGALGAIAMLRIGEAVASRRVGVVAALLYAVSPALVSYEASTLTEGLYIPLFLWSVAFALRSMRKPGRGLIGGVLCGLAYLTRPDALLAGLAMPFGLLLVRRWRAGLLLGLGFVVLAGPYIYWMSADAGRLVVSRKKSRIERFADRDLPGEKPFAPGTPRPSVGAAILDTGRTLGEASSWILLVLAIFGLSPVLRGEHRSAALLILALAGLEMVIRFKLLHSFGYLAERHLLTSSALLLPFAAAGLLLLPGRKAVLATALVATGLLLIAVQPRRLSKLPLKEAGRYIRSMSGSGAVVGHHGLPRVVWYAEGEGVNLSAGPAGEADRIDWLVLEESAADTSGAGKIFESGKLRIRVTRVGR